MSKTTLIKARGIQRYYGSHHVVKDLDFELNVGDILGFLGPNGAGKSTTMQIISGTLAADAGQIEINGFDLVEEPILAKQQIGYLPEQPPLYKELTVNEYLHFCARLRNIQPDNILAASKKAKQRCGLEAVENQIINNLSKGFQQRVGIAQAIIHNPAVIILDEPTVGLDPIQIQEIRVLITELGQQHGIILSTHILPEVQAVCNRVQIMRQGELVFNSDMSTIAQNSESLLFDLSFKHNADTALIESIDGIVNLERISEKDFCIELSSNSDQSELALNRLLRATLENNWILLKMSPRLHSLEQVFIELTHSDNHSRSEDYISLLTTEDNE